MRIIVLIKEVPDTYGDRVLSLESGLTDRAASDAVLDEIGERAVELAMSFAEKNSGTEIILVSMGPASAEATIRKGLAIGGDSAVQVVDERLLGADIGLTVQTLAAAVRRVGFDLIIAGNVSTDGVGGVVPAMLAELLDVPSATNLNRVRVTDTTVSGERALDGGKAEVSAELPAVISITERSPDARFPNFKGLMAAKKKPLDIVSLDDLDVDPNDPEWSRSIVIGISERPPRQAGVKITDEGDAGQRLAEFLIENRLA